MTMFTIDPDSGVLSLIGTVDREVTQDLNVTVSATSKYCGSPGHPALVNWSVEPASLLHVRVLVLDINDNPPRFRTTYFFPGVVSDVDTDTEVISLRVSTGQGVLYTD